jgi:hypothetical protein
VSDTLLGAALIVAWSVTGCSSILDTDSTRANVGSPYFDLIGIGWSEKLEDGPRFVWRQQFPGIEPSESVRVFKHLEGDDINECLAAIIASNPAVRSELAEMGAGTACGGSLEAIKNARELWASFGFAEALEEVAKLGKRGDAVAKFLTQCDALRRPSEQDPQTRPTP